VTAADRSTHGAVHEPSRLGRFLESNRTLVQAALDCVAWAVGLTIALIARYEFSLRADAWGPFSVGGLAVAVAVACLLQVVVGLGSGLYRGHWRFGSFDEVAHVVRVCVVVDVLLLVVNAIASRRLLPVSAVLGGAVVALVLMTGVRYVWRLVLERRLRPSDERAERALVFGAGEAGEQLVTSMLRNPNSRYVPVGLVDDDLRKRNLRLRGVPVMGGRADIGELAERHRATTVVLAVPSADSELVREISEIALGLDLRVRVLPSIAELLDDTVSVGDLRTVTEVDLLGRHTIDTDIDAIAGYLTGRRVLVTGAGGSIGSELCRQVARFAPADLVMVDRDESALHALQLSIEGRALLDSRDLVVADIRDRGRMAEVFAEHRPEVVFHAAALKHLPLLELHPGEAVKTNVVATRDLLEVASAVGVDRFINISTDKAADPLSVLGYSKRIAERLTAAAAGRDDGTYLSVRFGNVLGSRGSVLTGFRAQVDAGGPITVTDPEVTRYFMTVEEAVQLVVQAGAVGRDGEALVLDMGEPVRIDDVARRLAAEAPRPIEVVYTGLRPGEKLHECLLGTDELDVRPHHPLISQVAVPPLDPVALGPLELAATDAELAAVLAELALAPLPATSDERPGPDRA
jgi:FlaA1/EpsC-like NDP-sugar epimerase